MDKQHKEILRTKRADLVDDINIDDGLITQLLSRKIISKRVGNTIQACSTPEARTEKLLDVLNGPNAFQGLCDALTATEQNYIVDLYLKSDQDEKKEEKSQPSEAKCVQETETKAQKSQNVTENSQSQGIIKMSENQPRGLEHAGPSGVSVLAPSRSQFQYAAIMQEQGADRFILPKSYMEKQDPYCYGAESENRLLKDPNCSGYSPHGKQWNTQYPYMMHTKKGTEKPDYIDREHEEYNRIRSKHYITKDSIYTLPNMTPREVYVAHQEAEYVGQRPSPHEEYIRLRQDGMIKRPFMPSQDSHDHPGVKRLRTEETVILPSRDGSGGSICVRDPSYDSHGLYKPLPEIFLVDPCSQRNSRVPPIQPIGEFDDPDIDLTDGPVSVKVALCQRQFYLSHFKKSYAMRRIPRGQALIINVNEVEGKLPRRGTNIDRDNLHNLLTQLHFNVTVYNDSDKLTADDIGKKLQHFVSLEDHVQADCCVVCLLSHGEEGYLFGTDGAKLELDKIFSLFDNNSCTSLIGKPKIFFIQACRGGALDEGVAWKQADEIDGSHPSMRQLPTMSDMLICYPTQSGYYAWRNRERGSWYIEALVQVIMKYAKNEDMCTMLNRVNQLVSRKISRCPQIEMDQMSQMSEYKSSLRKPHLFFFPGIGSV
ncbi:uncharacterized protein LOC110461055 isoform X2 [Mizuhopecten yessoensis]|uniref:uncharacterized protein LOC110461055 isoform X2 n=1 Tax=Mizuhopecten yessoensis TaxID=6573 RepID=UPI000B45DAAF|nr:uncharacterized protein LOC110461055 isoform X2 [Mizuhopecten yessoensis]